MKLSHSMPLPQLEPWTTYMARVRVQTLPNYPGIWSEWSNEYVWTTDWGMSLGHHHTPGQPHCTGQGRLYTHSTLGNGSECPTHTLSEELGRERSVSLLFLLSIGD